MKIWSSQEDKLLIALAAKGKATRSSLARLDTLAQFPGRTANALYLRLLALGVDRQAKTLWSDQEMMALEELSVSGLIACAMNAADRSAPTSPRTMRCSS